MKVLFCPCHYIFDEYVSGSEFGNAFNVGDRLARANPGSIVVTGKKLIVSKKPYRIVEVQPNSGSYDMSAWRAMVFSFRYMRKGFRLLTKNDFDLIHHVRPFNIGLTFNPIPLVPGFKKKPFIIGSFSSPYKLKDSEDTRRTRSALQKIGEFVIQAIRPVLNRLSVLTLRSADRVIVYDEYTKQLITKFISDEKISIIPPGKDKKDYTYNPGKFDDKNLELICVGHLIKRKSIETVIRALPAILEKQPKIKLKIVGDGPERKRLEDLAEELSVRTSVYFKGQIENRLVPQEYKSAHILIHMAEEESHAQVYIEALASGLPIISADNVAASQILTPNNLGIVVPKLDYNALCRAVLSLDSERRVMKKMGREARNYFEDHNDWESVIIPKYQEVYRSVMEEVSTRKAA